MDNRINGLSEEQQAMLLYRMMASVMGGGDGESEEEEDDRIKCPVCSKYHEPREGEEEAAKKGEPASHGCLVVYIAHQCPICLDDPAGPPMIALPCGHLICQPDFQKLGGYLGDKPSDRPSAERPARRSSGEVDASRFISGLNMMRMMGMPPPFGFPGGGFGEEDDEEEDYEESDDESCPPLERVGGAPMQDTNNGDDSDDSMPPLEPVRRNTTNNANNSDNDEGNDDDDGSMPGLQRMDGAIVNDDDDDDGNDSDDSMPPLMPRASESDDEDAGHQDDDDDMPPLAPVRSASRTAPSAARARNDSPNAAAMAKIPMPALERVDVDSSIGSSSEEEDDADLAPAPNGTESNNDDDDDDDDSMPPLQRVGTTTNDEESDRAGEISEVDEDEEEAIPFPVLDRIRGASRVPTTYTREEYFALPQDEQNLGQGGAWIMIPSAYNEDYSTLLYTNDTKCVHVGVFARESRLIVNDNASILLVAPVSDASNQSDVWLVNLETTEQKYRVPTNAQCVSDGDGGVWSLTPSGGTKELSYYNDDSPEGTIVHVLPESSYLIMDEMGGVWSHVRKSGNVDVEPGLYYYVFGMGHNLISQPEQDAKCTTGADGVCVIGSIADKVQLTNIVLGETPRPVTLKNCAASKDVRVVPRAKHEGDRALYVHCRVQSRWKLCLLDESGRFSDICDCPKDARIVGDGMGGAWIFKRTGASHQMRMLSYVSLSGSTQDHGLSFPPGSKIAGM